MSAKAGMKKAWRKARNATRRAWKKTQKDKPAGGGGKYARKRDDKSGPVVDGLDVWWVCSKPNCTWFSADEQARNNHSATCRGQPEISF
jgi:hypothetical protein